MRLNLPSGWHECPQATFYTGSKWAVITRAIFYDGTEWQEIAQFIEPLSVSANDTAGVASGTDFATVTTGTSTATPTGGLGPYTYAWALISLSGGATPTIVSPSMATTNFRQSNVPSGVTNTAIFEVTATDSLGNTATDQIQVTFVNFGENP